MDRGSVIMNREGYLQKNTSILNDPTKLRKFTYFDPCKVTLTAEKLHQENSPRTKE